MKDHKESFYQQDRKLSRRAFVGGAAAAAVAISTVISEGQETAKSTGKRKFKLKYAPHFGMFRAHGGEDLVDQLKFMVEIREGYMAEILSVICADRQRGLGKDGYSYRLIPLFFLGGHLPGYLLKVRYRIIVFFFQYIKISYLPDSFMTVLTILIAKPPNDREICASRF